MSFFQSYNATAYITNTYGVLKFSLLAEQPVEDCAFPVRQSWTRSIFNCAAF